MTDLATRYLDRLTFYLSEGFDLPGARDMATFSLIRDGLCAPSVAILQRETQLDYDEERANGWAVE